MSTTLDTFKISDYIQPDIKQQVTYFHVFDDLKNTPISGNILFVTTDDKVYGLGVNSEGQLGLGHNQPVTSQREIQELWDHRVRHFANGFDFVLAINEDNHVFSWGRNAEGQLGRAVTEVLFMRPQNIAYFNDINISQISCGYYHSLALTTDGQVYGWGGNSMGQVGCGDNRKHVIQPILSKLPGDIKIKFIYACRFYSFALSITGLVYSWGNNGNNHLGYNTGGEHYVVSPRLISTLSNVKNVTGSGFKTFFLTNSGELYVCGKVAQEVIDTPRQLAVNVQQLSRDNHYKDVAAIRKNDSIYQILPDNQISRRDGYQDIEDFYAKLLQITYNNSIYLLPLNTDNSSHRESDTSSDESIEVIQRSYVKSKSNTMSRSSDHWSRSTANSSTSSVSTISGNSLPESNSYAILFRNPVLVGSGGFGKVYKVRHKIDKHRYAVKIVELNDFTESQKQKAFREMKVLVKVRSEYVVQYYNSWLEGSVLYIQMEFCSQNLQNILEVKPQEFNRQLGEAMDCVEYLISCEILIQILESVKYLHELNPQIIHRDLKPENILITENVRNGRFVKLCDFGLATVHDRRVHYRTTRQHTADVGDLRYIAPEVTQGQKYNHKCDVYALALIGGKIFDFDIFNLGLPNSPPYSETLSVLNAPVLKLKGTLNSMVNLQWNQRPECSEVLSEYNEWSIDRNILTNDPRFRRTLQYDQDELIVVTITGTMTTCNTCDTLLQLYSYKIALNISARLIRCVKIYHIFDDSMNEKNILFATNDDLVYGLGGNGGGCLGAGHDRPLDTRALIPELCRKSVKKFVNGWDFAIALTDGHRMYSWGAHSEGQLGRAAVRVTGVCHKPEVIAFFDDLDVRQVSAGSQHSLALTHDGQVYGWGRNREGQVGYGDTGAQPVDTPLLIRFPNNAKIKSIYCYNWRSFGINPAGQVFSWGDNRGHQLGHEVSGDRVVTPQLIATLAAADIQSIASSALATYYLSNTGRLYFSGKCDENYEIIPKQIATGVQRLSAGNNPSNVVTIRMNDTIHEVLANATLRDTNFTTFREYYAKTCQVTYHQAHCATTIGNSHDYLDLNERTTVTLVYPSENDIYKTTGHKLGSQVCCDFWTHDNHHYIQMEYCPQNLQNILELKLQVFGRQLGEPMDCVEYFISCEIFRQILE
ncbi:unnamed protein product, partial [Oppiella nova]